jgi:hypothetical protein
MKQPELFHWFLKGLLVWLCLSAILIYFGSSIGVACLPLVKPVLMLMAPDLSPSLKIAHTPNAILNYAVELSAWTLRPLYLNAQQLIPPQTELKSTGNLFHLFVPLAIQGTILCVWPVQNFRQRISLLGLGLIAAVLVILAILPAQLLGNIEIALHQQAIKGPTPRPEPWFLNWMIFCEMGGRWLLGLVAVSLCVHFNQIIHSDKSSRK